MSRIWLSPPDVGERERALLLAAFDSGWVAPVGEHIDAFEREVATAVGVGHAAALSSGTAALHLALTILGVGPGDEVVVPTLTFAATANAVTYVGARPVFVDADEASWQLDPALLAELLDGRARAGRLPAAVVTVDLYGQCADHDRIVPACAEHGVPVIEDAAEALGATYRGRPAGSLAPLAVLSFNGNKIITTSGGGMLVSDREEWVVRARHLATQARDPAPHYEHSAIGFNYRLSNLLAAVGRAQLETLPEKVAARRAVNTFYRGQLADLPGVAFMPDAGYGEPTWWLTALTIDPEAFGATREDVRLRLDGEGIEARPVWKPMHRQPVFAEAEVVGGAVAERLFERGLCLPSGSNLDAADLERIVTAVRSLD
jgi:dTDP-4-amino-4,6-dideoxygalactose transaminase